MVALYISLGVVGGFALFYFLFGWFCAGRLCALKKRSDNFLLGREILEKGLLPSVLDTPHEMFFIDSEYGYKLRARYYPHESASDKTILLLHGHNSSGVAMIKFMPIFKDLGYNVLIPDHRRQGESGGACISFSHFERHDTVLWMNFLQDKNPKTTFALFGESMGATTAIAVASIDKRVKFIISYCGFIGFNGLVKPLIRRYFRPASVFLPAVRLAARLRYGVNFKEVDNTEYLKNTDLPILVMHSKTDSLVCYSNAESIVTACSHAKLVTFDGARHARAFASNKDEFVGAVVEFVGGV